MSSLPPVPFHTIAVPPHSPRHSLRPIIIKLKMILSSKEALLVRASENKEVFLFDPKTTAVLHKFRDESHVQTLAYYPPAQQMLAQQAGKTFLSVWGSDSLQPESRVSLEDRMSVLEVSSDGHFLMGGSAHGVVYLWEMPCGLLLAKKNTNGEEINSIIEYKDGHLITVSKSEVHLWPLSAMLITQEGSSLKRYHCSEPILRATHTRSILALLSQRTVTLLQCSLQGGREFEVIHKISYEHASVLCSSSTSLFVGEYRGGVDVIDLAIGEENTEALAFSLREGTHELEINKPKKKRTLVGKSRSPVNVLAYVSTLAYLVAGHESGEVVVWSNYEVKKSLQLFKSGILEIRVIARPQEMSIAETNKIKSLHKHERSKEEQPLHVFPSSTPVQPIEAIWPPVNEDQVVMERMLGVLTDPKRVVEEEVGRLRVERELLVRANLHYFDLLRP